MLPGPRSLPSDYRKQVDYVALKAEVAESGQKNRANSLRAPEKQKPTVPGYQDSDRREQDAGPEPTLPSPWEELQSIEWAEQELGFPQRKGVQSYSEVAREILQGPGEGRLGSLTKV